MTERRPPDAPSGQDLARLRSARRMARAAVAEANRRCLADRDAAFRRELATTIRSVSPLLVSLMEIEGLALDDVAGRIAPTPGWPERPRLSRVVSGWGTGPHALRHALAAVATGRFHREPEAVHGVGLRLADGRWAHVGVVAHSLEVSMTIGKLRFETRHGELHLIVRGGLPATLAAGGVGRPFDDFVLHPATTDRGWRVDAILSDGLDTRLVVPTGAVPWRWTSR